MLSVIPLFSPYIYTGKLVSGTLGIKSLLIRPYASIVAGRVNSWRGRAVAAQQAVMQNIVQQARNTEIGKQLGFDDVRTYNDITRHIPIGDYEQQKQWFDAIAAGKENVTWPGKPTYLAKTSGTTSGTKYIPITKQSVGNHFYSAQTAMMLYMAETGNYQIMDGRMIFLSGSPELESHNGIHTGRLSGIVNHQVPSYLKGNQLPSWQTNCMDDWEAKLDRIVDETIDKDMRLISGIPPWVQMYFDKLTARTGKPIKDIFPNFQVFVYGGVSYEPYRARLEESIGKRVDSVETYPASEGFIAYQDSQKAPGLLLNANSGIFFEFVPAGEIFDENPTRLMLDQVETDVNYSIIINSNAGLWGYVIGDTVKFVSLDPYRLVVTGRIKHFISAFGEHVIGEEVEQAMLHACAISGAEIIEFTVAPMVDAGEQLPYHEWLVEFEREPEDMEVFKNELDNKLRELNSYYDDLITGAVLQALKITTLKKHAFINLMRSRGKLGGQNKVPRLANDRKLADELQAYINA